MKVGDEVCLENGWSIQMFYHSGVVLCKTHVYERAYNEPAGFMMTDTQRVYMFMVGLSFPLFNLGVYPYDGFLHPSNFKDDDPHKLTPIQGSPGIYYNPHTRRQVLLTLEPDFDESGIYFTKPLHEASNPLLNHAPRQTKEDISRVMNAFMKRSRISNEFVRGAVSNIRLMYGDAPSDKSMYVNEVNDEIVPSLLDGEDPIREVEVEVMLSNGSIALIPLECLKYCK